MALETRFVAESPADCEEYFRAARAGFLNGRGGMSPEELELRRAKQDLSRARGVFDGERCVATYRSFDQRLTAVGGAEVASNAVAGVTVSATHRRRGLLSRLIAEDLAAAKERGDVVATLVAAEYRIYGRFGFGPTTSFAGWRVDATRAGLDPRWSGPECGGTVEFVDVAEVRKLGPELHERFRRGQPGAIDRTPLWWEKATGALRFGSESWREPYCVLYRDAEGVPQGLAGYLVEEGWQAGQPAYTASLRELLTTTPAAERALVHFLLSLDWVTTVEDPRGPVDALLPDLLPDPRAARITQRADFLWLRPLDIPRMLAARGYAAEGELVLDVRDPLGITQGRFRLAASPEGARCTPTSAGADLALDTGALGRLYLGDDSAARLAALGALTEETPGAVARADLLLRTGRRPFCPDMF